MPKTGGVWRLGLLVGMFHAQVGGSQYCVNERILELRLVAGFGTALCGLAGKCSELCFVSESVLVFSDPCDAPVRYRPGF